MKRAGASFSLVGVLILVFGMLHMPGARATPTAAQESVLAGEGDSFPVVTVTKLMKDADTAGDLGTLGTRYESALGAGEDEARQDLIAGNADFAVTGKPFTSAEVTAAQAAHLSTAYVPYAAGPLDIVAAVTTTDRSTNKSELITGLHFSMKLLAEIFTGGIATWNDPAIAAENPQASTELSEINAGSSNINIVTREDSSSTTTALVAAFLADPTSRPIWEGYARSLGIPPDTPPDQWPATAAADYSETTGGEISVIDKVMNLDPNTQKASGLPCDSIGYISDANAQQFGVPVVDVTNLAGQIVSPTAAAVNASMSQTTFDSTAGDPDEGMYALSTGFDYTVLTGTADYPIPLVSYLIVPTVGADPTKVGALDNFVQFVLGTTGQGDVTATDMAPVSSAAVTYGTSVVVPALTAEGTTTTTSSSTSSTSSTSTSSTSTSSTTSTSTTSASTTSTTVASAANSASGAVTTTTVAGAAASSSGGGSSDPAVGAAAASTSAGASLPFTGSSPWVLVILGGLLVIGGDLARRRSRQVRA